MPLIAQRPSTSSPLSRQTGRSTLSVAMALFGLALIGGAIVWGFFADREWGSKPEPEPALAAPPAATVPTAEVVSIAQPASDTDQAVEAVLPEPEATPTAPTEPAPETAIALADSDVAVRAAISELNAGTVGQQFAAASNLIERAVSLVDNLAAGSVPYRLIPIGRPKTTFPTLTTEGGHLADPAGYARFDGLADWVGGLDAERLATLYRTFEPAAREAYDLLGYEDGDINERIEKALRLILAAPDVPADAVLIKREALWVYADPALEALPDLQKQLLRLGPDNLSKLQNKAREIVYALEDSASPDA